MSRLLSVPSSGDLNACFTACGSADGSGSAAKQLPQRNTSCCVVNGSSNNGALSGETKGQARGDHDDGGCGDGARPVTVLHAPHCWMRELKLGSW